MYEAEYRLGVQNAGFDGFRILLFQQDDGINAASGEAGLKFTVDFGLGAFNALNFGDVMNDVCYQIRPYEVTAGETDRAFNDAMQGLTAALRDHHMFRITEMKPEWLAQPLAADKIKESIGSARRKTCDYLLGRAAAPALAQVREPHLPRAV